MIPHTNVVFSVLLLYTQACRANALQGHRQDPVRISLVPVGFSS